MKYVRSKFLARLVIGALFFVSLNSFGVNEKVVLPGDLLASYLKNLNQFSADISETLKTDSGQNINNTGHVWIQRPNQFRYEIHSPETQVFVSDGKNLYDYEPDLMQVIVRPLDQSISQTPLLLLSSGALGLENKFKISFLNAEDHHQFLLIPLAQDGLISQVVLIFDAENIPEKMQVSNSFGQVTALNFSNVVENQKIPKEKFEFTAPKGVDVLGA